MSSDHFLAIEAGGTKIWLAAFSASGAELERVRVDTGEASATLAILKKQIREMAGSWGEPRAVGLASFGPLDLDERSEEFGSLIGTPNPGWSGVSFVGAIREITPAPMGVQTDVNAAALAEGAVGACRGVDNFAYVTVGTGIGVGIVVHGTLLGGIHHTEVGHMRVSRAEGDRFEGSCPFHKDCLEGMASGRSMEMRWGQKAETLPSDHDAWRIEADYLAQLCLTLNYTIRVERIVLGGGVMNQPQLLPKVRQRFHEMCNNYAMGAATDVGAFLVEPGVTETTPGLYGAYLLAKKALA